MIRALALGLVVALLATAAACDGDGGNPDRVLQLSSGSLTEDQLRSEVQEQIADQDPYETVCAALDGLTDDQAVRAVEQRSLGANPAAGFVFADEQRSIQILREECEAVFGD